MNTLEHQTKRPRIILLLSLLCLPTTTNASFEPYDLNGGLISGVAGRNYILLASDTRLSSGYEISSRSHLNSRLWRCSSGNDNKRWEDILNWDDALAIPKDTGTVLRIKIPRGADLKDGAFIGSAGCAADCESLKRSIITEVQSHSHWMSGDTLTASHLSVLLGNILYARRSFPFYSFCLLAGFDEECNGVLHVYDAIGSHERVATACAGSGREMMQPILDCLFSRASSLREDGVVTEEGRRVFRRDGSAVAASEQKYGLSLISPVKVIVDCGVEEAIGLLIRGYRSVAEREISVGDDVVICVLKLNGEGESEIEIRRIALKKH